LHLRTIININPPAFYTWSHVLSSRTNNDDLGNAVTRVVTEGALTGAQLMRSIKLPSSLKPGIWGAVIGAAGISVLGFAGFGWTLGGTAERMAKERAEAAVVDVLTPICVEKFHAQAGAPAKLMDFRKASTWDRRLIIENGGWATVPGTDAPHKAISPTCAERLQNR